MGKPLSEMTLQELWQLFPIIVKEYDPAWKTWYAEESDAILTVVGRSSIFRLNHIGSTAVEGLTAKPTVDILLEITTEANRETVIQRLIQIGWCWIEKPSAGADTDIAYLTKGYTENGFAERVFHLHVRRPGDWNELYFRDYLRENPATRQEYAQLKRELFQQYEHDRDAYTTHKTEFVRSRTQTARQRFSGRYLPRE